MTTFQELHKRTSSNGTRSVLDAPLATGRSPLVVDIHPPDELGGPAMAARRVPATPGEIAGGLIALALLAYAASQAL